MTERNAVRCDPLFLLAFLLLLLLPCLPPAGSVLVVHAQTVPETGTHVVLLGTGTPNADPARSGPATAIVVNGTPYLVDFGPGVVRRAAAAGIKPSQLRRAFLTHLHSDHTAGYPDLILTAWTLERAQPLEVYGPPGTQAMTDHLLQAYEQDIAGRINGLEPANTEGYKVNVHEIEPGIIYRDENVTVKAFRVNHGDWQHAFGFHFETADRTIVISGDTAPSDNLVENARGCDVLVHEVYSQTKFAQRSPEWQKYHSSFHTSTVELGQIAAEVKPGLLLLTHVLFWGATESDLLSEVKEVYDGRVVVGEDLGVY